MWALTPLLFVPVFMLLAVMEGNILGAIGIFIFALLYCWPLTLGILGEILVKLGWRSYNPWG